MTICKKKISDKIKVVEIHAMMHANDEYFIEPFYFIEKLQLDGIP